MKMFKKALAFMLMGTLLTATFACSGTKEEEAAVATEAPAVEESKEDSIAEKSTEMPTEESEETAPIAEEQQEILVMAAASMTDVCTELGTLFEEQNPNIKVNHSFGASGALQTQIEEGAPADIFISAAQKQMDVLDETGKIDQASRIDLLENKIVLITPKDSGLVLESFADLTKDEVKKIGLGEVESVPVGRYSEEVFTFLGVWDAVKEKAVFGSDVRTVLSWVEMGEVDCGVVYSTDAATTDQVKVLLTAPVESHKPVIYPAAILSDGKNKEASQLYLDFLKNAQSKALFEKYGFEFLA